VSSAATACSERGATSMPAFASVHKAKFTLACLLTLVRPATSVAASAGSAVEAPADQMSLKQGVGWEDWDAVRDQALSAGAALVHRPAPRVLQGGGYGRRASDHRTFSCSFSNEEPKPWSSRSRPAATTRCPRDRDWMTRSALSG
jgi:hypothetical protein